MLVRVDLLLSFGHLSTIGHTLQRPGNRNLHALYIGSIPQIFRYFIRDAIFDLVEKSSNRRCILHQSADVILEESTNAFELGADIVGGGARWNWV